MKRQLAEDPAIVSLKGVSKTFSNGTVALDDVCLSVRPGEILSLLGPSGCGKSTVLRIIAGLAEPSAGKVTWPQEPANRLEHDLSFVFQEPTLMPWATVYENIRLPLRLKRVAEKTARADISEALEMVGLSQFAESYPRELSGGMKMRVSIARALVTRPRVLLMDEPFAALDEITRFKLNNDLLHLWQRFDLTIVFVTHSVFESVYLSERIAIMRSRPGRVADELVIDTHLERNDAFRTSPEYAGLCGRVSAALHDAMSGEEDIIERV
ncbi:ABC transporter ATP-binding protein [uncultured Roseibium sp.]|uniref:ABC transporter ATP-binding protein n=1 Tax=uncultured Roseibium sp. TaxID=1936171 RepID=UPI00260C5CBD|nr:ABC transporter ATP-binding protein [uncultured Roseibium sp.]